MGNDKWPGLALSKAADARARRRDLCGLRMRVISVTRMRHIGR